MMKEHIAEEMELFHFTFSRVLENTIFAVCSIQSACSIWYFDFGQTGCVGTVGQKLSII
ncbi:hypothetical protein [Paenibacillus guangzhouensis]|uniref:hypothetical protein n=1 Tax=Paenibacillus guangzhouensis TaxID=1473112 RepID=UPI00187B7D5B|nr:hypothetical protein [Paenibacillus guangzhouensis]